MRLQSFFHRRGNLQIADLALPDVEHNRENIVHQPIDLPCGYCHQTLEQVGVGGYGFVGMRPDHELLRGVALDHGNAFRRKIAQSAHEAIVVPGDDDVYVMQIRLGKSEERFPLLCAGYRKYDIELPLPKFFLDRREIRQLKYLEPYAHTPFEDFQVVGNDSREIAAAVDEFIGGIVRLRADSDDRMLGQPGFLFGVEFDADLFRLRLDATRASRGLCRCDLKASKQGSRGDIHRC